MLCAVGGIAAYRLVRRPSFSIQGLRLRSAGRLTRAGIAASVLLGLFLLLTVHCLLVKVHQSRAEVLLAAATGLRGEACRNLAGEALGHLRQADRYGLVGDGVLEQQLGEVFRELGRRAEAEQRFGRAIVLAPRRTAARLGLVDLLLLRGAQAEAFEQLLAILEREPDHGPAPGVLGSGTSPDPARELGS